MDHLGIKHVVAVVGPSMGGMQTLQWGVSQPDFMDSLVALVPLAKTPAWSVVVLEASRKAIMLDPAWNAGDYTSPPVNGLRLSRDILAFLAARSPERTRTPGMNGDYVKALRAIKAKTLIMGGQKDLLNPEWEPVDAACYIRDARVVTIRPEAITGHAAAGGAFPADVDLLNAEVGAFLDVVTNRGAKLRQ